MNRIVLSLLALLCLTGTASADLIVYRIPGTTLAITMEGRLQHNAGGSVFYFHPKLGKLTLDKTDIVEHYEADSKNEIFRRMFGQAKTADEAMEAGDFALRNGLVDKVYDAAEKAIELEPNHPRASSVLDLRRRMNVDLGESLEEERRLREMVRMDGMEIAKSKHFILLHDTPMTLNREESNRKDIRSVERLQLLEKVYESFLLKFYAEGKRIQIPQERLMVVLFNEEDDFYTFAEEIDPSLSSAIGFWDPKSNISFFFDHGSSEQFAPLRELAAEMQKRKEDYIRQRTPGVADYVRRAELISMLVEIDQENSDIEVVSHECTHQMAGNTGLFPRHVMSPSWVHEGLATYFEAPKDASWSGIGAVNELRLEFYKALAEQDKEHSNIDFIIGDQIFDYAATHGATLHGYAQAWALTHFLLEKHFDEFIAFYGLLAEMPPDVVLTEDLLTEAFDECFQKDRVALNSEWHRYMKTLQTDKEKIIGGR